MSSPNHDGVIFLTQEPNVTKYYAITSNVKANISLTDETTNTISEFCYSKGGGSFTCASTYSQAPNTTMYYKIVTTNHAATFKLTWVETNPPTGNVSFKVDKDLAIINPSSIKTKTKSILIVMILLIFAALGLGYFFNIRRVSSQRLFKNSRVKKDF